MKIDYYKKNVYGNENLYVKDAKIADLISRLTGKKTINESIIKVMEQLGFEFKQVLP